MADDGLGQIDEEIMSDPDGAETYYKKSIATKPTVSASTHLARLMISEKRYSELEDVLKDAIKKSDDPFYLELLGGCQFLEGHTVASMLTCTDALKADPNGYISNMAMASCLMYVGTMNDATLTEISDCIERAKKANEGITDDSSKYEMETESAYFDALSKNYDSAEAKFVDVLKKYPTDTDALNGLDILVPID